jgi:AhpD family alkylhydroperoxidase
MEPRIDFNRLSPEGYKAMLGLERYLSTSKVERKLLHLIKLRVSQMNGCAFCLDMHWKDLQVEGESEQRMYSLDAWRETPITRIANEPRWPGQRRSPISPTDMRRMKCSKRRVNTSANRNWRILPSPLLPSTAGTGLASHFGWCREPTSRHS